MEIYMAPGIGDSMTGDRDGTIGDGTIGLGHHGDGIDGAGTHGPGLLGVGTVGVGIDGDGTTGVGRIGPGTTTSTETAIMANVHIPMSTEDQIQQLRDPDL